MDVGVWAGNNTVATSEYMSTVATTAERLGYASVWVSDHVVYPEHYDSPYPYGSDGKYPADVDQAFCEALTSMTWLAARTERITVGSLVVVVPQRDPWLLGKQLATLDHLNGGRTVLGAGMGWLREEFDVLHAPFDGRFARGEEAIELMRAMWSTNPLRYDGRAWQSPPVGVLPHPAGGRVPVWLGGNSETAQRRVARLGDGWVPYGLEPDQLRAGWRRVRELAEQSGRDPGELTCALWTPLWLADPGDAPWCTLHGSADALVDRLGGYADAGLEHLVMFNLAPPEVMVEQLEQFAAEVLPAVGAIKADR